MAIRNVALAGMISDTSLYNIDGACVVGGAAAIPVGTAVRVSSVKPLTDGHKSVVASGIAPNAAFGVVVRSSYETPDGNALAKAAVNVLTSGRIWMRTTLTEAPNFGTAVLVNSDGVVTTDGVGTGWTFAGGFIANTGTDPQNLSVDGALVEVQVKQK